MVQNRVAVKVDGFGHIGMTGEYTFINSQTSEVPFVLHMQSQNALNVALQAIQQHDSYGSTWSAQGEYTSVALRVRLQTRSAKNPQARTYAIVDEIISLFEAAGQKFASPATPLPERMLSRRR